MSGRHFFVIGRIVGVKSRLHSQPHPWAGGTLLSGAQVKRGLLTVGREENGAANSQSHPAVIEIIDLSPVARDDEV